MKAGKSSKTLPAVGLTLHDRATAQPRRYTPLYHWHVRRGAQIVDSGGWRVPQAYADAGREARTARDAVGIADVSAVAKRSLLGSEVPAITPSLVGDGAANRPGGVSRFDASGPALACRLTDDHLLLLANTTNPAGWSEGLAGHNVVTKDVTHAYAAFCLVGPNTEAVLRRLTAIDVAVRAFPAGSCVETGLAGVHGLLVRPPGSEIPTVYLLVSWDLGEYVWDRLLEAGRCCALAPVGLAALADLTGFPVLV